MAFGLMIRPNYHGVTLVRHSGGLKGVSSHLGFIPEHNLGVAVLSNLEDKPVSRLWLATVNAVLGLELETPLCTLPADETPLAAKQKFAGYYRSSEPWGKFDVRLESGTLFARSGEKLAEAGRVWLAPNGEFFVGSGPHYDGGRTVSDDRGNICGVQLGTRYLVRRIQER